MDKQPKNTQLHARDENGAIKATFVVGTDVMDYIEPARTFGRDDLVDPAAKGRYQARMIALPDRRGPSVEPMVLTLGKQQRLALVRRTDDASAGWESLDVAREVMAFGAAWTEIDGQERITVAVAVKDVDSDATRLLVAYDLDGTQVDWCSLPWVDYGTRGDLAIDAIRLQRDTDQHWTLVLSATSKGQQDNYLVRSEHAPSLQQARVFTVPSELKETLDLDLGTITDDATLFALGVQKSRDTRALFTRRMPFVNGKMSITGVRQFKCPANAHVLALGAPREDGNDLYVGGDGVHRLANEELIVSTPQFEEVIAPELARDIQHLSVCENREGATSVWALLGNGSLLMTYRDDAEQAWNEALAVRSDVIDLAPVMGDDHLTAGVLVVYRDGHAGHLWRDAQGIWQESEIRVADPLESASMTCFATNISISNGDGIPLLQTQVSLRTSVLSTLVVNGKSVTTGPDTPALVTTDVRGGLRIFNRALSFAPPLYRIDVEAVSLTLEVNPAATLYARFSELSVKELQAAKSGDAALLADEYRTAEGTRTVEALVAALKQASALMGGDTGSAVRLAALGTPFDNMLGSHLKDDYCWGVSSDSNGTLRSTAQAQALALQGDDEVVLPGLGESLSDLLEGLWARAKSAVKAVVNFVVRKVQGVIEFVCEIAGKVKRFVLDTLEKLGGFFKWIWAQIKTGVQKAWDFVKFLFDWGDIKKVRDYMIASIDGQFKDMLNTAEELKGWVGEGFDSLRKTLDANAKRLGIQHRRQPLTGKVERSLLDEQRKAQAEQQPVSQSGPGAWVNDLLGSIVSTFVTFEPPEEDHSHVDVEASINQHIEALKAAFDDIGNFDTEAIFGPEGFKLAELDLEKIQKLLATLLFNIADVALQAAKELVTGMITLLQGLIQAFRVMMFTTIRFPFMEKTFALLTAGQQIDTSFRLIDVVVWPVAVLVTTTCKLALGETAVERVLSAKRPQPGALTAQSSKDVLTLKWFWNIVKSIMGPAKVALKVEVMMVGVLPKALTKWYSWVPWTAGVLEKLAQPVTKFNMKRPILAEWLRAAGWFFSLVQIIAQYAALKSHGNLSDDWSVSGQYETAAVEGTLIVLSGLCWLCAYWLDHKDNQDGWELTAQLAGIASGTLVQLCILSTEPNTRLVLFGIAFGIQPVFMVVNIYQGTESYMKAWGAAGRA